MEQPEIPLAGGNLSPVVRVGDTVRRPRRPWSAAVHGLLRHLEAAGFAGAPRFLGIDQRGREILGFVPGEVGNYPLTPAMWADAALVAAGRLLRGLHDATVNYAAPAAAPWQFVYPDAARHEVICHNDAAPYNTVYVGGLPRALIDFDTAGPGPRLWDLAYAAYTFVPLTAVAPDAAGRVGPYEPPRHAAERGRRLRLFAGAYGLERVDDLLAMVEPRLEAMCDLLRERSAAGDPAYRRLVAEGHLDHYRREIAFLRQHASEWGTRPPATTDAGSRRREDRSEVSTRRPGAGSV